MVKWYVVVLDVRVRLRTCCDSAWRTRRVEVVMMALWDVCNNGRQIRVWMVVTWLVKCLA
jgi:hypothetical protein